MARITSDQWQEARAMREAGSSITDVAKHLGVDRALVSRRAKTEQWGDGSDVEDVLRKKVTEKVTGIVTTHDPKKREAALDAEAVRRANIQLRHRDEWDDHIVIVRKVFETEDFEKAKLAKIMSETLKIRQDGERKAWGLDKTSDQNSGIADAVKVEMVRRVIIDPQVS